MSRFVVLIFFIFSLFVFVSINPPQADALVCGGNVVDTYTKYTCDYSSGVPRCKGQSYSESRNCYISRATGVENCVYARQRKDDGCRIETNSQGLVSCVLTSSFGGTILHEELCPGSGGGGSTATNPPSGGGTTGEWGACGCFGSGDCIEKPNNEGPTHPANECQQGPSGCVWNPGLCASGGGGGGTTYTPRKAACGQACTINADCQEAATGAPVACIGGTCQNALCPGNTIPGANCDCNSVVAKCGDQCGPGAATPDCGGGDLSCAFTQVPEYTTNEGYKQSTGMCWDPRRSTQLGNPAWTLRCVGKKNPYYGISICNGGDSTSDNYLVGPHGKSVFTEQEILSTCLDQTNPTPPPAPQCLSVTPSTQEPLAGEAIYFTCGISPSATRYEFRYVIRDGDSVVGPYSLETVEPGSNVSKPITVAQGGQYVIQCRPCNAGGCSMYEPL